MSLDLYFYVRADADEYDDDWGDYEFITDESAPDGKILVEEIFWENITHNLTTMAGKAGLYSLLWRPKYEYTKVTPAFVRELEVAVEELKNNKQEYTPYNPANGWGNYEGLLSFAQNVLSVCHRNPEGWIFRSV